MLKSEGMKKYLMGKSEGRPPFSFICDDKNLREQSLSKCSHFSILAYRRLGLLPTYSSRT